MCQSPIVTEVAVRIRVPEDHDPAISLINFPRVKVWRCRLTQ
jgi:hypothetical protein